MAFTHTVGTASSMSPGDAPGHGGTNASGRDERQLRLYESLERRVDRERRSRLQRLRWGGLGVVALLGYAVAVGPPAVVALTPIFFGLLVMDALRTTVTIWYLQRHLIQVETALREREPLFAWVSRYGSLSGGRALELGGVNLNEIPRIALYLLLVTVYLALVVLSIRVWPTDPTSELARAVSRDQLLVAYGSFSVAFALIVGVVYLNFRRLRRSVDDLTLEASVE